MKLLNENSSLAYKIYESNEKETKERMDMFMVKKSEKNQDQDWLWTNY